VGKALQITTLGGLAVKIGETPVAGFLSRKVEALLVYLACDRRPHPRELLLTLLWDDLPQERALSNLRTLLSNLQKQVGPYLVVDRKTIGLNLESAWWLDVVAVENAIVETEHLEHRDGRLSDSTARALEEAMRLYRGDFLAGFHVRNCREFEGWMLLQQERLRGLAISALHKLIDHALYRPAYEAGIAQASQLLSIDQYDENAHRKLMRLLAQSGRRSAALAQFETCRTILREALDVEPDEETVALFQDIQLGKASMDSVKATNAVPHNLLAQPTPFVVRPAELSQVAERLDNPHCRLLTLVGLGGTGKTRLALQAGTERFDRYPNGVFFFALASIASPDFLPATLASTLQVTLHGEKQPLDEVIQFLRDKHMLLIMDNFEHLLDGARLLGDILAAAPDVKIIATSREPLHIVEEWLLDIEGLEYPDSDQVEHAEGYNAVQLFVQSASRVQANFSLAANRAAVVRICRLVEGMPLGIELAAAWVRVIPCSDIAASLERNLDLLGTSLRNFPERHRTIGLTFEYSWNLLAVSERDALAKLSIFRGGFSLEAARTVADATPLLLMGLAEKSLVRLTLPERYDIHELVRRCAGEKLVEASLDRATRESYLAYYLELADREGAKITGPDQGRALELVGSERDNFWECLSWALDSENFAAALRLAVALSRFWFRQGLIRDGLKWLERILSKTTDIQSIARAQALHRGAYLAWMQGAYQKSEQYAADSLALCEILDDKLDQTWALNMLGMLAWTRGENREAQAFYRQCLAIHREMIGQQRDAGVLQNIASTLQNLGNALNSGGEYAETVKVFEESLAVYKELGNTLGIADILLNLGDLANLMGNFAHARSLLLESIALYEQLGLKERGTMAWRNLAETALGEGDYAQARQTFEEVLRIREASGATPLIGSALLDLGWVALAEGQLDQAQTYATQSKELFDSTGHRHNYVSCLNLLGNVNLKQGDLGTARQWFRESAAIANSQGNKRGVLLALIGLGQVACATERVSQAIRLFSCIEAQCREIGMNLRKSDREDFDSSLKAARAAISHELFDVAWLDGQALTLGQAVTNGISNNT